MNLQKANKQLDKRRQQNQQQQTARQADIFGSLAYLQPSKQPLSAEIPAKAQPAKRGFSADFIPAHPSLLSATIHAEKVQCSRAWLLLRHLDRDGRGWLPLEVVKEALTSCHSARRMCGWRRLRQILAEGEGTFWERDDNKRVWIYSPQHVGRKLDASRLQGDVVAIPLEALLSNDARAAFYAAFHAGRPKRPISRAKIAAATGIPERTQRDYDKRIGIERTANHALEASAVAESREKHTWAHGRASYPFIDHHGKQGAAGQAYTARRLPNSYNAPYAILPAGRKRKINRRLKQDLVTYGEQGNSGKRERLFHANGKDAARVASKRDAYYPTQVNKVGAYRFWGCMLH